MLRAVLFDCDGVIADSEQLHFTLIQKLLREWDIELTKEQYLESYLAMDDKNCFTTILRDNGRCLPEEKIQDMIDRKTVLYKQAAGQTLVILPGVVEFVMAVSQKFPLAMASGALKEEVLLMLETAGVRQYFDAVIAAEDVVNGKPAPDAYLKALEALNKQYPDRNLKPQECLVVEDSKHGVVSAHAAGMKCVAVCTSYSAEELAHADKVVPVLTAVRVSELEALFT
ncbi:MAG: HAD family phosphatase [Elusimicrobia bacterium]|nr:HAD family phosphatase [Elusimicrobiota bacterium]